MTEVLSHPVVTCKAHESLLAVERLMRDSHCNVVVVVDDAGRLTGMLTPGDIRHAANECSRPPAQISVASVLTTPVLSCAIADGLTPAIELMRDLGIRRMPLTDDEDRPVAVLSVDDTCLVSLKL